MIFNDLPYYLQNWEKIEKHVANLIDKIEYVTHTRNLKQALNHGLVLKKMCRFIKLNQEDGLKSCTDMNKELRKNQIIYFLKKKIFQKNIF